MIKTAQDAYLLGRQAAMEKISMVGLVDVLANYLGAEEAKAEGNKRARMSIGGVLAPTGYTLAGAGLGGLAGGLAGLGVGAGIDAFKGKDDPRQYAMGLGALGGVGGLALGGLGGYGYGLYRGYQIPGEM